MVGLLNLLARFGQLLTAIFDRGRSSKPVEPRRIFRAIPGPEGRERTLFQTIDWNSACADTAPAAAPRVMRSPRRRGRGRRIAVVAVSVPVIALVTSLAAVAYWTTGGTGSAGASVGTLNAPTDPAATSLPGSGVVHLTWTASTFGGGAVAPTGYYVKRYLGVTASVAGGTCGTPTVPVNQVSCDDTGVASGTYTYTIVAVYHSWTAESDPSDPVGVTNGTAPSITSANSTTFTVGSAGSFTVTTTGSPTNTITNASFAGCTSSAPPSGVTLTDNGDNTATVAGTPAAATGGTYTLCLNASNGFGSDAHQSFTLTVNQAPAITSANSTTFTVGSAGSFTATATGFPTPTFSTVSPLPTGVTLSSGGVLSGTPGAGTGGTYPITLKASNGAGSDATQSFTLNVNQAPAITSANSATFTVGSAGSFTATATGFPAPTFSTVSTLPTGVTLSSGGVLSGTPAAGTGGTYPITLKASNGVGPDSTQSFTLVVNQAAEITSANNVTFTAGSVGSFTVTTTGFPARAITNSNFSGCTKSVALPSGVTFADNGNSTATLSGIPAAATGGTYTLCLNASNGVGSAATQTFTLTVNEAPIITSANSTTFTVGSAGTFTATASGFPTSMTWGKTGALPTGVILSAAGVLSGTPAAGTSGTYTIALTASNGVIPDGTQSFTLTVNQAPAITSANSTTFTAGSAGSFTVTTTGFPARTITNSNFSGCTKDTLPSGVTFVDNGNSTATLAGTPLAASVGTYTLCLNASNGVGSAATQAFTLTVNNAAAFTSANSTTATVGTASTFTVTTSGTPAVNSITNANFGGCTRTTPLPTGVSFNYTSGTTATITTTAASIAGAVTFCLNASNGVGSPATQTLTLTIAAPRTLTARASTDWNLVTTWLATRTGTITTSTGSTTVTGSGTSFLSQVRVGDRIYRSDFSTLIGTVASIASNTSLTLTSNALNSNAGAPFTSGNIPANSDDVNTGTFVVTIPASYSADANSVTVSSGSTSGGLVFAASSSSLTVATTVSVTGNSNNNTQSLTVNAGTLTVGGNLTVADGNGNRDTEMTVTSGTVIVGGDLAVSANTFSAGAASTFIFNGGSPQTLPGTVRTFGNLTINNTGSTVTLNAAITVNGDLSIQSGTFANGGNQITGLASGKSLSIADGATYRLAGTTTMVSISGGGTKSFGATSTVDYAGANQTVTNESYGNLSLSGSGTKTMPGAAMAIAGNFSTSGSVSATAGAALTIDGDFTIGTSSTFNGSGFTHTLKGNFSRSGTFTPSTSTMVFGGTSPQTIGGSATTFNNLTIGNAVSLNGVDATATGTLALGGNVLSTGANTMIVTATAPTRTTGFIDGALRRNGAVGTLTFPVGNGSMYTPVDITVATITATPTVTARSTAGEHPNIATSGISSTKDVNTYWTLGTTGTITFNATTSATFNYPSGNVDGGATPASFQVKRWNGSAWSSVTVSGTPTSTSTSVSGLTSATLGDFVIGNP